MYPQVDPVPGFSEGGLVVFTVKQASHLLVATFQVYVPRVYPQQVVEVKAVPSPKTHPVPVAAVKSKLGTGLQTLPLAFEVEVVVPEPVLFHQHQADLELQAVQSLFASEQADINLQVPTVGVVVLPGVKAQTPSVPPPLQASFVVYVLQVAFTMQFVPLETHPFPLPAPVKAIEQAALQVKSA